MNKYVIIIIAIVAVVVSFPSCKDIATDPVKQEQDLSKLATFDVIQSKIFNPSCAISGCHSSTSDAAYSEHQLVLEQSVAYQNLVNVAAKNSSARADGLMRVKPFKSDSSLLIHKLHFETSHHAHNYGNPMPLGKETLTNGQIEFIEGWIDAGAPKAGIVVDVKLLQDTSRAPATPFTQLPLPVQGVQLNIEQFTIQPNFEREIFVYRKLNNPTEIFVKRVEVKMRPNSHHFLFYTFRANTPALVVPPFDVVRDIRNPDGTINLTNAVPMAFHVFFAGSQTPTADYFFPPGVALRLPSNATLDMNTHFVNKTSSTIIGEVSANIHTIDRSQIQFVAGTIDWGNTNFSLPAGQVTTVTKTFTADSTMRIFMLTSHFHARGQKFVIRISGGARNGEIVYTSTSWEHPEITQYDPPIILARGQGLTSEATYNNTTNRTLTFGLTSEDEMDIIFGYFY